MSTFRVNLGSGTWAGTWGGIDFDDLIGPSGLVSFADAEADPNADVYFEGDEIQIKLQKAIATLPQKQQLVFNMRYFDEVKYKNMSEILDTSEGALKSSYHLAVKKIEAFLTQD